MTPESPRHGESGVILINVLSVLALASAVMVAILTLQDVSIERSTRFMDSSSAAAYAMGGELSAVVALRRDLREAPESDHFREAWATVQQENTPIDGGAFSLVVEDEQARFNLNNLLTDGLGAEENLRVLLQTLQAPHELSSAISAYVISRDGLEDIGELAGVGVDPVLLARMAEVACVLPASTDININTAGEAVLAAVLGNRASVKLLIAKRERQGFLTPDDLASARVLLPARIGFRSDYYAVSVKVTSGTITQSLTSRLHRTRDDARARVSVWSRKRNVAARLPEPPLSN